MKICYIGHGPYPYNVPFYVHTQILAQLGCEVHAIAAGRLGEPSVEQIGNVLVHRLPDTLLHQAFSIKGIHKVASEIRRILSSLCDISLVHVRSSAGMSLLPLSMRRFAPRWIMDVRSPPLHSGIRTVLSRLRLRVESIPYDRVFVHASAVAEEIYGKNHPKVVDLPIGVEIDHFTPGSNPELRARLGIAPTDLVAVYSGSANTLRELDRMVQGFALACQASPNLHLMLIGEGNDLERLKQLTADLGISQRAHFLGFTPYKEMPKYLQAADIGLGYVPITAWYNKAPVLKTMEFLASGLATIATATYGNQNYICHHQNGLLTDDTPTAIGEAILELYRCPELCARLRSAARDSVRKYDFRTIVQNVILPTYRSVVTS